MISKLKGLLTTTLTLVFLLPVTAQLAGYKHFALEKDNRHIQINTLFKDQQGYLLAGTDNGLYKFDGQKYTRIDFHNPEFTDSVSAIFQDRNQKIWIGFKSGRIANVENKKLLYFNPEEGTPVKKITAFLQDKEGNLWFSTQGEGIYYLKNKHLYLINTDDGLSDANVSSLLLADNGDVIAGTDQGINICSFVNGKKSVVVLGPKNGLPDYIVTAMIRSAKNTYWIGLQDKGFCLYDHSSRKIVIPEVAKSWKFGQINSMLLAQNTLWIATQDKGFYKYSLLTKKLSKSGESTISNRINSVLEDNQGNIWLAVHNYGLVRSPGASLKLMPIPSAPPFEHVHVVLGDTEGNIWINNKENQLIRLSEKEGSVIEKRLHLAGISDKTDITSICQDINGNIWVGAMGKGLYIVDPLTFSYRVFNENNLFINSGILSISGRKNKVYVSSLVGSMEIELTPENKDINKPCRYTNYDSKSTGTNYIYSIFKDSKDRIWFATDGKGLTMLQGKTFTYYGGNDKIKDERIYSVTEDKKGNIWFSTASAGVYKFDGKSFTNFNVDDGLSDLNISVLKADRSGNIIIVHKKGLDVLDPGTGNISYLTANQGLSLVNAEDLGAITTDTSGNVMVSTVDGILTYSFPENSTQKPTALIESVQLFLKEINEGSLNIFNHDENNFTFNYTGLYYTDPEKVYYRYKLEGFDSSWVITSDRSKNFPKLEPGDYSFRIQASLNKNFRNADEATYSFRIKQAFYKTWWFLLGCATLLVLLTYLYIKNRERELKKIQYLQQEKIHFQFEVLRNQVNPHFLFNSFNTLISAIEEEPKIAVEYAEQLSAFFRNIVNQRDKDIISLADELDSLGSYTFLQKKRYGDSLQVDIRLSEEQKSLYQLPPLSLQLLMENAIKHNAVSKETPLLITITIDEEEYLCIRNNRNPKLKPQEGAGMGLQNIMNRYGLLTHKPVKVLKEAEYFIVLVPLLK